MPTDPARFVDIFNRRIRRRAVDVVTDGEQTRFDI